MWSSMRRVTGIWEDATQSRFFSSPLCAKISETPSLPGFSVEGGEGNAHEEVRKRWNTGLASAICRRVASASRQAVSASFMRCVALYRFARLFSVVRSEEHTSELQ